MVSVFAPRRIGLAFAIFLLLGALGVGAAGFGSGGSDLPKTFQVEKPRVGDRGVYTVAWTDANGELLEEGRLIEFEWQAPRSIHGADGVSRATVPLRQADAMYSGTSPGDETVRWAWEPARYTLTHDQDIRTGQLRVVGLESAFDGGTPANVSVGYPGYTSVDVLNYRQDWQGSFLVRIPMPMDILEASEAADPIAFCGSRSLFQTAPVSLAGSVEAWQGCSAIPLPQPEREGEWGIGWSASIIRSPSGGNLRAVGAATVDGVTVVAFDIEGEAGARVWFSSDNPYPVRFLKRSGAEAYDIRLSNFQRGDGPLISDLPMPALKPDATPFDLRDEEPWGLPESPGIHPYPPSQAWADAKSDEQVAAYLADHPDARPYWIAFSNFTGLSWDFGLSDATSDLAFSVTLPDRGTLATPDEATSALRLAGLAPQPEVAVHAAFQQPVPRRSEPLQLPTAESLLARAADVAESQRPDGWTFRLLCEQTCQPELTAVWNSNNNGDPDVLGTPGTVTIPMSIRVGDATMDGNGTIQRIMLQQLDVQAGIGGVPPLDEPAAATADSPSAAWRSPDALAYAAAGSLGLLAAAAYLLAPYLKGLIPGFSRVAHPELASHPRRAAILAAVESTPGIHAKELARATGLAWGALQHHARKLESAGLLHRRKLGAYACYFRTAPTAPAQGAARALRSEGARRLLDAARGGAARTLSELAQAAGLSPSTAHYHLQHLQAAGLLRRGEDGGYSAA